MVLAAPPPPSPARNAQAVADKGARAIGSFSQWFGPYPFGSLSLTQMPGELSQGWPGLVFLSSYAFLSPQEQTDLRLDSTRALLSSLVLPHETAHQWWGDLVLWNSYRDQWIVEGLANYSALLVLEQQNPAQFRQVLERYRSDLLSKNKDEEWLRDAGPVTLGQRLISSHFPGAYEAISYERGTWLFHMLRCMLRDSEAAHQSRKGPAHPEEPFFRVLRKVREHYAGKNLTTQDLVHVFEEELPRSLWFENRRSLDWFLDGWINGTAMPRLEARDVRITPKERGVSVAGVIAQKDAPDDLVTAIPVYGVTATNATVFLGQVLADGPETSFHLNAPAGTRKIVLDPRQTVLSTLK
jgi:aminopeptidase N